MTCCMCCLGVKAFRAFALCWRVGRQLAMNHAIALVPGHQVPEITLASASGQSRGSNLLMALAWGACALHAVHVAGL